VIGIQQGIHGRVGMRQYDTEISQLKRNDTVLTKGLYTIDGVQRNPTDDKEQHNDGQVLCGFHFSFLSRA
jgi:hypothetical protein